MKRVLIVDDVPEIRRLLRICAMHHFEVHEAANAEDALLAVKRAPPDLMVLDIGLSGPMDGLDLLAVLRKDTTLRGMRVVILSGRGLEGDDVGLPVDAYFTKPFRPMAIMDCIERMLASTEASPSTFNPPPAP